MQNKTNSSRVALLAILMASATALEVGDQFEIHGYGDLTHTWSNVAVTGQRQGAQQTDHDISLVAVWQADERTKLWAQWGKNRELKRGLCRNSALRASMAARPTPIRKPVSRTGSLQTRLGL